MAKVLSIIIPTYNMEKYLRKCLKSLIHVDSKVSNSLDVIIVNDGSKDNSLSIAQEYENLHPQIFRVIDKPNANYGSCINAALPLATGKYVKVLDADDSFETENLKEMVSILDRIDVDLFISDYCVVNGSGKLKKKIKFSFPKNTIFHIEDYLANQNIFQMHSITYKTVNLQNINYWQTENASYTDVEWVFSPITTLKTAYYFPRIIYRYLIGRSGQTVAGNTVHQRHRDRLRILEDTLMLFNSWDHSQLHPNTLLYLENHLAFQIHGIYITYLFVNQDGYCAEKLDNYLINNAPNYYYLSNAYKFSKLIPYRFILSWRKTGKLPSKTLYNIYKIIQNIFSA